MTGLQHRVTQIGQSNRQTRKGAALGNVQTSAQWIRPRRVSQVIQSLSGLRPQPLRLPCPRQTLGSFLGVRQYQRRPLRQMKIMRC